jgi:tripartite-type tricarboxylate transporter receptor subunit TctC
MSLSFGARMPQLLTLLLSLLICAAPAAVHAQVAYPDHTVRIIVPFPPGGPADVLARLVGEQLSHSLAQPFVVENKPGAGGNIGMEQGAKSPADGYTLILAPVGNLTVSPYIYSKLPYDPVRDFTPVTVLAAVPNILVVNAAVPARSLRELIALAKAKPGTLNFASPGNGSGPHLAGELLKRMAGIDLVHVPYNGVAPAMNAVLAGDVQLFFSQSSAALPQLKGGRVVALGVASLKRIEAAPDLPTIAESGLPGFDVTSWYSLVAPAGTPTERVARLHAAIARAFATPEVRARIAGLGAEPVANTPAEFATLLQSESARWRTLAREANIHAD